MYEIFLKISGTFLVPGFFFYHLFKFILFYVYEFGWDIPSVLGVLVLYIPVKFSEVFRKNFKYETFN